MKFAASIVSALLCLASPTAAAPTEGPEKRSTVSVSFPGGSVNGRSLLGTETFAAVPFAQPPVGNLRLRPPQRLTSPVNNVDGTGIAPACPQMYVSTQASDVLSQLLAGALQLPLIDKLNGQEDCLTVTVQRPAGTKPGANLPVLYWIFGGGFELGGTFTYDATSLLTSAVLQGQPFVFVAVNYRVAGFGFLAGKEILADGASNLGLLDQRMGLEWVADNIAAFGGDPSKVTIWGESAGSISVFDQMLLFGGNITYKGENLFRGAIMDSGTAVPAEPVDGPKAQAVYDHVVSQAGCSGASNTLDCLRQLPYQTFYDATTSLPGILSYNSVNLAYLPRPDGKVLVDSPDVMAQNKQATPVPFIVGDQEDEGTLFSLFQNNVSSTDALTSYLSDLYFPQMDRSKIQELVETYPDDPSAGSPFRTSIFNEFYPGFKRVAALLGDITFTLTRRLSLEIVSEQWPDVPSWSYLSSYDYGTPVLGTFHASDILQVFYGVLPNHAMTSARTYYLNFLYNLDPNQGVGGNANWPQWKQSQQLMWFQSAFANSYLTDNFREDSANVLRKYIADFRI